MPSYARTASSSARLPLPAGEKHETASLISKPEEAEQSKGVGESIRSIGLLLYTAYRVSVSKESV
jgi:hypothetical protein